MGGVFINYQRRDSHDWLITQLNSRLRDFLGRGQVFLDRESIDVGKDYRKELEERVADCEVLLAVIHDGWLACRTKRVDDPTDWVRVELEMAIRLGKKIIPIIVDDTRMPTARQLPRSIHQVAYQQAHRVRHDSTDTDISDLVDKLELVLAAPWKPLERDWRQRRPVWRWLRFPAVALALVALAGPAVVALDHAPMGDEPLTPAMVYMLLLVLVMLIPLPLCAARVVFAKPLHKVDAGFHEMPLKKYHRTVGLPFAALGMTFLLSMTVGLDRTLDTLPFTVLAIIIFFAYLAWKIQDEERREQARSDGWPQELSRPVRLVAIRRELVRLERKLLDWDRPRLSWRMREQSTYILGQLTDAMTELRTEATRGRREWLTADHPVMLSLYLAWIGSAAGMAAAVAVPQLTERNIVRPTLLPLVIGVVCGAAALGTAELTYRRQRADRHRALDNTEAKVGELVARLDGLVALRG